MQVQAAVVQRQPARICVIFMEGSENGQLLAIVPVESPSGDVGHLANAFEPGAFVPEDH